MDNFKADDRVICINGDMSKSAATGRPVSDFRLPGGFIQEGGVYHVYHVESGREDGSQQLRLTGYPVYSVDGQLGGWTSLRFRHYRVSEVPNAAVEVAELKPEVVADPAK